MTQEAKNIFIVEHIMGIPVFPFGKDCTKAEPPMLLQVADGRWNFVGLDQACEWNPMQSSAAALLAQSVLSDEQRQEYARQFISREKSCDLLEWAVLLLFATPEDRCNAMIGAAMIEEKS